MYKYDLGHILFWDVVIITCWERLVVQSMREREVSLPPSCNRRRVWWRSGQEVVATVFSLTLYSSLIVYSAACGLLWFFPPLWVFHVNLCVIVSFSTFCFCFGCVYFVHTSTVRLWPNELGNQFLSYCHLNQEVLLDDLHEKLDGFQHHQEERDIGWWTNAFEDCKRSTKPWG